MEKLREVFKEQLPGNLHQVVIVIQFRIQKLSKFTSEKTGIVDEDTNKIPLVVL